MSPRGQSDMCADRPGMDEALGLIDGCPVCQGNDHANSWCGHQSPTNRIMADCVEKHFMEDGKLLPHDPPDGKYWLDDQRQPGKARDQLADPCFEFPRAHHADLESEIAQCSTQITFDVEQFPLQELAARQQHSLLLSHLRLHMHWLEQANPHHL